MRRGEDVYIPRSEGGLEVMVLAVEGRFQEDLGCDIYYTTGI